MHRSSPRFAAPLGAALVLSCAGCGRFGFDALDLGAKSHERYTNADTRSDDDVTTPIDGDSSTSDGTPAPGGDGSTPSGDPGMGGGSAMDGDASVLDTRDAATPPADASPPASVFPLPANVGCSTIRGAIACDDFDGSRTGVDVSVVTYGGSASTVGGYVSLSAPSENMGADARAGFNALTSGAVYLRFSLFVPSGVRIDGINLASVGALDDADFGLDLNLLRDGELELYTTSDGVVSSAAGYTLPRDRWLCMLLKVESIDDGAGSARLLVDGTERIAATNIDTLPQNGVTGASAGIDWAFNGQSSTTLYLDNFVVAREHPGDCP